MADREDCDEEGNEEDICPTQRDVEELKRKLKPPDRARFERELEKINVAIREHEAKFRSLQSSRSQGVLTSSPEGRDRETLMTELRGYKAEREKEIDIRKKIDQELKGVNSLVQQKNDACGKVQAGLKYKSEARADEAIRRLEHQMRVQQLKLREEKRLVSEIDALKRSKKLIHEFDALKHEIGQLRDKQNALRKQRDNCMRTVARLKSKEEEIKSSLDKQRSKDVEAKQQQRGYNFEKNTLKKEIDDLYSRKRALVTVYNKEKEEYSALLKDIREQEKYIKREVEAMKRIEQKHSHRPHHGSDNADLLIKDAAHEKMLNVCDSLINYIKGLNINAKRKDTQTIYEQKPDIKATDSNFTGGVFLKKKMDDDLKEMYAGAAYRKSSKRGSRKERKSAQKENVPKKLILHPIVLDQLLFLTISPPSTAAEVPKVLELLIEKKTNLNSVIDLPDPVPRSPSPTSSSASSLENFPSLPSQQQSMPSLDELEDEANNENNVTDEVKNENGQTEEAKSENNQTEEVKNENNAIGEMENEKTIQDFQEIIDHDRYVESEVDKIEQMNNHGDHYHAELKENNENTEEHQVTTAVIKETQNNSHGQNNSLEERANISEKSKKQNRSLYGNDVEGKIICSAEEKPSNNGLTEDHLSVISTDNLANNSKANSSIKCPS